jgi:DNA-binding MarR family transcriptional regulator
MISTVKELQLSPWEVRILQVVRSATRQEKAIAKYLRLNDLIVSEFVTELMLKGYIERRRRRWMLFFSREYFSITIEGLAALEAAESKIDRIMEFLKDSSQRLAGGILAAMPPLARDAAKTTYKMAKFILK